MLKNKFTYLLGFSAFVLVTSAAFFSVTGLAKLFSGSYWSVIVMISGLELAKLVATSYLYRYWNKIELTFKTYLIIGVTVLMLITSVGVYGFLSAAFSETSSKVNNLDSRIELLNGKKTLFKQSSDRIKNLIDNKTQRINNLNSLRTNQESRIDTLYKKNMISGVRKAEQAIKDANNEIELSNKQIDALSTQIQPYIDSISKIDLTILELKNSDIKGDIGPLKYIAILTKRRIEDVVNWLILLLVFVFDPLAVCLVIATNRLLLDEESEKTKPLLTKEEVNEAVNSSYPNSEDLLEFQLTPSPPEFEQEENKEEVHRIATEQWKRHNGENTLRIEYPFTENSTIFDIGQVEEEWVRKMYDLYKCNIFVFEGSKKNYNKLIEAFKGITKIKIFNLKPFNKEGQIEAVNLIKTLKKRKIDLMKIDLEGEEYGLLLQLMNEQDTFFLVDNYQIQFHNNNKSDKALYSKLHLAFLKKGYEHTYCYAFVWENYKKIIS